MKRSIIIAILAITVASKSYDQQFFLQKGDTVTVDIPDLFGHGPKPYPTTPQSIYTYISNSPAVRVASARELISGSLNKDSVNCGLSKVYGSKLLAACGNSVQIYNVDQKSLNFTFASNFDAAKGALIQDFTSTQDGKFMSAVTVESSALKFYFQIAGKGSSVAGAKGLANRVRVVSFPNGASWIAVAYEKAIIGATSSGANTIQYADTTSGTTASIPLTKASKFIDDAEHILDIQATATSQILFVTYTIKGSNTPKAAYCTTKIAAAAPIFALDTCTAIELNPALKNGKFVVNTFDEKNLKSFQYNTDTNMFTQCTVTAEYKLINCLSNKEIVRLPTGQILDHIQPQADSNVNFVFVHSQTQSSMTQLTMVFNIRNKMNALSYDQVTDVNAHSVTSSSTNGFVLRKNTFSSYAISAPKVYLVLNSVDFPDGYGAVTIENNDGHNPIVYRTISVKILNKLNSFAGLNDIIRSQIYTDGDFHQLPTNKAVFDANNPSFTVNNAQGKNDNILLHYDLKVNLDSTGLEKNIWFTCFQHGVTLDDKNNLYKFNCTGHAGGQTKKCVKDPQVMATLEDGHKVIYASKNEFEPENGIVVATTKDKTVNFYYFGIEYEETFMKSITVPEPVETVYFKITGKLYTFYVFQKNQVLLYAVYNKELAAMPNLPYGVVDKSHLKGGAEFCPVNAQKCPLRPTVVHIQSNCDGDNRLFTFKATNVTNFQGIHERSLNNIVAGTGPLQACTVGFETFVFNPATGTVYALKTHDEYSLIHLNVEEVGYNKITGLHCIRDEQAAIITGTTQAGKTQLSVLNGNKFFDGRNRYHSTFEIDGDFDNVSAGGKSNLMIAVKKGTAYTFHAVWLNGPLIYYQGSTPGSNSPENLSLSLTVDAQVLTTKSFNVTSENYNANVNVQSKGSHNSSVGVYDFFDLATITGPIFDLSVDNSTTTTITPRLLNDNQYQGKIQAALNLHEPDFIHQKGRFGVGFRTFTVSTLIYYYHNYDQFWFMEDTGYLCPALDVAISNQDFAIAAMACNEGGEFHLRWFIKSFSTGSGNDFIQKNVIASEVKITQINDNTFLVLAVNGKKNTASNFILTVSHDQYGNYWVSNSQGIASLNNIETAGLFAKDNTAVVLFTNPGESNLNARMVFTNGTMTNMDSITLPASLQIKKIECKMLGIHPSCIIFNNGNIIGDVTFNYNGFTHALSIAASRAYKLHQDYIPTNWNFNEDFLITKANNGGGEVMLVYSRGLESDNHIWWGLTSDQYYNVKGAKSTRSVPVVLKNANGKTVFRFTQNQLVGVADEPSMVYKAFKAESSLLILSSNIDENQAGSVEFVFNNASGKGQAVPASSFFDKHPKPGPNPPGPTPPGPDDKTSNTWLIWLLGGVCVVLAIVIILLLVNKDDGDDDEDDDEYDKVTATLTKTEDHTTNPAITMQA